MTVTRHSTMRNLFRLPWRTARQIDDDVEEELRFHLDMRAQELVAKGAAPEAALDEARRQFGDLEYTKHYCRHVDADHARHVRRMELFSDLGQDVAYALRMLRRTPAFTAVAVLTLALGIGANTAIFSVVNGVLLKPLPYPQPDRLVRVFSTFPGGRMPVSPADLAEWRARSHSFRGLSAITNLPTTITGEGADPERLNGIASSTNLFDVLSVRPLLGRTFTPGADVGEARREVILSEELWKRRFGADPRIVGKSVLLDAVALVLLIASANVANLLLARASARQHELAIRTAIGAGRTRIARQLLTESIILALCGAIAGLGLAAWGTTRLASLARDRLPRLEEIRVDHTVLLVTLAVAVLTGILFGL